jgi:hypothetical protein
MTPGLVQPLPRGLRHGLRALVFELLRIGRVRRFAATLSVGVPGGARVVWRLDPSHPEDDHALRAEIVAALLARARELTETPVCWLTRTGEPSWHDLDAAWLSPAACAYAEAGVPLAWVVVTRSAWWDPRSDLCVSWKRPRVRSGRGTRAR